MRNIFHFLLFCFICLNSKAQSSKVDGLVEVFKNVIYSNPDTAQIIASTIVNIGISQNDQEIIARGYKYKGGAFQFSNNYDSALYFTKMAITLFEKKKSNFYLAQTLVDYAQIQINYSNYKNALDTLLLAEINLQSDTSFIRKERTLSLVYYHIADCYKYYSLYDKAIEYEYKSINAARSGNSESRFAIAGLAAIYFEQKQYAQSFIFYRKAIELCKSDNDKVNLIGAYQNISNAFVETNSFDSASFYNEKSIQVFYETYSDSNYERYYYTKSLIEKKNSNYAKALFYNKISFDINSAEKNQEQCAICNINQGEILFASKNYTMAKKYFLLSLDYFKKQSSTLTLKNIYQNLINTDLKLNNFLSAEKHFVSFDSVSNELVSKEKVIAFTAQEIKYETSLKEATINTQQTELKAKTQQRNWLIGGGIFALLAATTLGVLYRRTKNQKEKIQQQKTIIEKQKQEILHSQSNSFRLIRSMFRRQGNSNTQNTKANDERLYAFSLLHEILYNDNSNETDLKNFLQKLCDARALQESVTIKTKFPVNVLLKADTLRTMGIMLNELTSNAVKHAFDSEENRQIDVLITKNGQTLSMVVKDNGKGLPPTFSITDSSDDSFGLGYVKDLAEQNGGSIKASNENGAIFEISIKV